MIKYNVYSPPRKQRRFIEPSNIPSGPWLPLTEESIEKAVERGKQFKRVHRGEVDSPYICESCGGLTSNFFKNNKSTDFQENLFCECDKGVVVIDEKREWAINISQFIGELRYQNKNGRMPYYWPKINIEDDYQIDLDSLQISHGNSAFRKYKPTLEHIAKRYEMYAINFLAN